MPTLNPGGSPKGSPGPAILAFMGMAGGAYYLYKQKGTDNPQRVPDTNPNSVANKELPGEPDHPRLQDYLKFHPMAGVRVAQDLEDLAKDQKDFTKDLKDFTKDQKDLTQDQKDLTQDQKDSTKEQKDLTKDQKDFNKYEEDFNRDLKNLTKYEDLIIALAFKDPSE